MFKTNKQNLKQRPKIKLNHICFTARQTDIFQFGAGGWDFSKNLPVNIKPIT